jgi:peptide/nickel transport system permease protein
MNRDEVRNPLQGRLLRRLSRRGSTRVGLVLLGLFLTGALLGPPLSPRDPLDQNLARRLEPPGREHPLGTDELGRDVFSRLLHGTRISLTIGVVAVAIGAVLGTLLGLAAGYFGGWVDLLGMRVVDVMLAFPSIVLAIVVVASLGPSFIHAMIAVGIVGVPHFARLIRSEVLTVRATPFVEADRAIGSRDWRILWRTILPHCSGVLLVQVSLGLGTSILEAAGLSFLGLGAQAPLPDWGAMLAAGREYVLRAPWVLLAPGVTILLTVLGFNLVGDALRDALDPRMALVSGPAKRGDSPWRSESWQSVRRT